MRTLKTLTAAATVKPVILGLALLAACAIKNPAVADTIDQNVARAAWTKCVAESAGALTVTKDSAIIAASKAFANCTTARDWFVRENLQNGISPRDAEHNASDAESKLYWIILGNIRELRRDELGRDDLVEINTRVVVGCANWIACRTRLKGEELAG
jgi:hypothetical protein